MWEELVLVMTLYQVLKLRFPQDLRAKEVRRLLQSAEPVRIAIQQRPEVRYAYDNRTCMCMHVHVHVHVSCLQ